VLKLDAVVQLSGLFQQSAGATIDDDLEQTGIAEVSIGQVTFAKAGDTTCSGKVAEPMLHHSEDGSCALTVTTMASMAELSRRRETRTVRRWRLSLLAHTGVCH